MRGFSLEDYLEPSEARDEGAIEGVVEFLLENPRPTDDALHAWADAHGYDHKRVEEEIYRLLAGMIKRMSRSLNVPDGEFNPDELAKGVVVEQEHTDSPFIARMIAKDHLLECPTYYSRLSVLESRCKGDVSTEGAVDGKRTRELEYTIYGKLADLSQLSSAIHKEEHEQWLLPVETEADAKVRIRAINNMRWVLTTKLKYEGKQGCEEVECDISKDMFDDLKLLSTGGMKKMRYVFKADQSDLVWEVDVFKGADGKDHPWVKFDLEVADASVKIPPLPMDVIKDTLIARQGDAKTPEDSAQIKRLWSEEWVSLDPDQRLNKDKEKE